MEPVVSSTSAMRSLVLPHLTSELAATSILSNPAILVNEVDSEADASMVRREPPLFV
jgi:hypothetical protein